jgi:hypothetical protein
MRWEIRGVSNSIGAIRRVSRPYFVGTSLFGSSHQLIGWSV